MAFPVRESVTATQFNSDATAHAVSMPATVNAGNVLLCLFVNDDSSTVTTPSGWTFVGGVPANGQRLGVYKRVADGTEGGTTVDFVTSEAQQAVAQVYRLSGASGDVELTSKATGASNNPNPPSLNPAGWDVEDTKWLAIWLGDMRIASSAIPASYSDGVSTISTGGNTADRAQIESAHRDNGVASEDPGTFTTSGFPQWSAWTIAIRPAATNWQATVNETSLYQGSSTLNSDTLAIVNEASIFAGSGILSQDYQALINEVSIFGGVGTLNQEWEPNVNELTLFGGSGILSLVWSVSINEVSIFGGSGELSRGWQPSINELSVFGGSSVLKAVFDPVTPNSASDFVLVTPNSNNAFTLVPSG